MHERNQNRMIEVSRAIQLDEFVTKMMVQKRANVGRAQLVQMGAQSLRYQAQIGSCVYTCRRAARSFFVNSDRHMVWAFGAAVHIVGDRRLTEEENQKWQEHTRVISNPRSTFIYGVIYRRGTMCGREDVLNESGWLTLTNPSPLLTSVYSLINSYDPFDCRGLRRNFEEGYKYWVEDVPEKERGDPGHVGRYPFMVKGLLGTCGEISSKFFSTKERSESAKSDFPDGTTFTLPQRTGPRVLLYQTLARDAGYTINPSELFATVAGKLVEFIKRACCDPVLHAQYKNKTHMLHLQMFAESLMYHITKVVKNRTGHGGLRTEFDVPQQHALKAGDGKPIIR